VSSTLREQLIKAGLATEKQAKKVSHAQRQRGVGQHHAAPNAQQKQDAERARAAKAARDEELNRQQKLKAERKALIAEIRQIVEQHRLPKIESDDKFNFVDERRVRFVLVDGALRERLNRGEVAIVRYGRSYEIVPAETANRIRERDERSVIALNAAPSSVDESDPYKDFAVPDDLTW